MKFLVVATVFSKFDGEILASDWSSLEFCVLIGRNNLEAS